MAKSAAIYLPGNVFIIINVFFLQQVFYFMKFFLTVTDKLTPHSHSSGPNVVEFGEEAYSFQYF